MPQAFLPNCWQQVWHFGVCFPIRSGLNGPAAAVAVAVAVAVDCSALCALCSGLGHDVNASYETCFFFSFKFFFCLICIFVIVSVSVSFPHSLAPKLNWNRFALVRTRNSIQFNSIALIGIFCGFVIAPLSGLSALASPCPCPCNEHLHCLLLLMLISYPTSIW